MKFFLLFFILFDFIIFSACNNQKKAEIHEQISFKDPIHPELNALNDAIQDDPDNAEYYFKRAKFYLNERNLAQALLDANRAVHLDQLKGNYFIVLSKIYKTLNKSILALNAAKKAEALNAQDAELSILLSQLYFDIKDIKNANYYLNQASIVAPLHSEVFVLKGKVAASNGDTVQAFREYLIALEKDNESTEALKELSQLYESKGQYDSAMVYTIRGLNDNNRDPFFYYQLGNIMEKVKHTESAKECYLHVASVDSTYYPASLKLADMFLSNGNDLKAYEWYMKAFRSDKLNIKANMSIAQLLEKNNKGMEAIPYYRTVTIQQPDNKMAFENLQKLNAMYFLSITDTTAFKKNDSIHTIKLIKDTLLHIVAKLDTSVKAKKKIVKRKIVPKPQDQELQGVNNNDDVVPEASPVEAPKSVE